MTDVFVFPTSPDSSWNVHEMDTRISRRHPSYYFVKSCHPFHHERLRLSKSPIISLNLQFPFRATDVHRTITASTFYTYCILRPNTPALRLARRTLDRRGSKWEPAIPSERVVIRVELLVILVNRSQVLEVDLVTEEPSNATESFDELSTLLGAVGDKLEVGTKILVLLGEPLQER